MIEIRPARLRDAVYVGWNLRPEDEREVRAATGRQPSRVLADSFRLSRECYAMFRGGSPLPYAVFGVADDPEQDGLGVVWMLCTPEVAKVARATLKLARPWLDAMGAQYPLGMHNLAHRDNYLHVRWCTASGFVELGEHTRNGHTFIHIHRPQHV